jgi:uncharacterized RDD family membrane protein YckC
MKNIEIKTTQNVVLQYELADFRDRLMAFFIDFVCIIVLLVVLSLIGYSLFSFSKTAQAVFGVFLSCVFIFYSLVLEVNNHGQSIGKMAMRIRVIKTAGGHAKFSDYAARWVFRMVDIYFSLGGIASILIASSTKAQRIGDIVANTAVVKLTPRMDLVLNDLLALHAQNASKPTYLMAKQLVEEDVLLIKTTLDRYRNFKNEAHQEALDLLTERIQRVLQLESAQPDKKVFLQTVLNDYVVLTR